MKIKVKHLKTFGEKAIGLIGSSDPYPIYFQTRWGIHTFGVKYPIDVLILDRDFRVVKMKKNLLPNRIFFWNLKHNRVLEIPEGEIYNKKISIGMMIILNTY